MMATSPSTSDSPDASTPSADADSPDAVSPTDRPRRLALRCDRGLGSARVVRRAIEAHCEGRVSDATLHAAQLIASELVTNGIEHGGDGPVTIDLVVDEGWVTLTVTSSGDPRLIPPLGTWWFPDETQQTGRGLALTQRISHAVELHNRWGFDQFGSWVGITASISP